MHNTKGKTHAFYVETLNREKPRGGREEFTIIPRLQELFARVSVLGLAGRKEDLQKSLLLGGGIFIFLICVHEGELYGHDLRNCTICTC